MVFEVYPLNELKIWKGWFVIFNHKIRIRHTGEMEKAMQQSHNIGYAEYERSLEKRIKVEKDRDKEYRQSTILAAELNK